MISMNNFNEDQLWIKDLTTAEILYHLPDHPAFLQTYLWQEYDTAPTFPCLRKFLDYWEHHLDGRLHSVVIAHASLRQAGEFTFYKGELRLH